MNSLLRWHCVCWPCPRATSPLVNSMVCQCLLRTVASVRTFNGAHKMFRHPDLKSQRWSACSRPWFLIASPWSTPSSCSPSPAHLVLTQLTVNRSLRKMESSARTYKRSRTTAPSKTKKSCSPSRSKKHCRFTHSQKCFAEVAPRRLIADPCVSSAPIRQVVVR